MSEDFREWDAIVAAMRRERHCRFCEGEHVPERICLSKRLACMIEAGQDVTKTSAWRLYLALEKL